MISDLYLWIKALHIISVIAWMAGLLYLPRLFVYHCAAEQGSVQSETFKVMERRLLKAIMGPAMMASWIFGLTLLFTPGVIDWSSDFWMHGKLSLVLGLTVVHVMFARHVKAFAADNNQKSEKFFRILNEVPTVIMIGVVILVIVRPF